MDPQYKDREIDDSKEMIERLLAIPKLLIDSATFIEDKQAIAVDEMMDNLAKGIQLYLSIYLFRFLFMKVIILIHRNR